MCGGVGWMVFEHKVRGLALPSLRSGTLRKCWSFSCVYPLPVCVDMCAQIVESAFEFDRMLPPCLHLCFVPPHCIVGLSAPTCVTLVSVLIII